MLLEWSSRGRGVNCVAEEEHMENDMKNVNNHIDPYTYFKTAEQNKTDISKSMAE